MKINLSRQPAVYGVDWHKQKLKGRPLVLIYCQRNAANTKIQTVVKNARF